MKSFTRTLPLRFQGELHDVELVQFSLDPDEARANLPEPFSPRIVGGRALVSVVNVRLVGMRPRWVPRLLTFGFRHIAIRMMIDDRPFSGTGEERGIFFLRSFTEHPLIAFGADWLSHYRLTRADVHPAGASGGWEICQGDKVLRYRLDEPGERPDGTMFDSWEDAEVPVASLDRAYAVDRRGDAWRTVIRRPDWPLVPASVRDFRVDFFESARLEGGFRVAAPVPYVWEAPERVAPCAL
jgi:hypothetical protein